jgi:hypothetical protein
MAIQTAADSITSNQGSPSGFKNRVINGGMVIDQRNAGASVTPSSGTYMVDRFQLDISQSSKYTFQRNGGSVTPPNGFRNYLGMTVASGYSITSSDYFQLMHKIEGYNTADLMWGTTNAKTVTLSFWVYSNLNGTFGGAIRNNDVSRSYPFTYTITTPNTWTYISITIPGDTTGTWATDNTIGIQIAWGLGNGSNYTGPAFAWAGTNYQSATGTTSIVATTGNTFYLTGVQLEVGSQSTAFDYRPYGTEENLCLRYYEVLIGSGYYVNSFAVARMDSASSAISVFQNRVIKRASPTYTASGAATAYYNSTSKSCTGADFAPSGGTVGGRIQWLSLSGGAVNTAAHVDTGSGCLLTASAEL